MEEEKIKTLIEEENIFIADDDDQMRDREIRRDKNKIINTGSKTTLNSDVYLDNAF